MITTSRKIALLTSLKHCPLFDVIPSLTAPKVITAVEDVSTRKVGLANVCGLDGLCASGFWRIVQDVSKQDSLASDFGCLQAPTTEYSQLNAYNLEMRLLFVRWLRNEEVFAVINWMCM